MRRIVKKNIRMLMCGAALRARLCVPQTRCG